MRTIWILLLGAAGLTLVGCDSTTPTGEPSTDQHPAEGTLVVSTNTEGEDPDPDGYQLIIDGIAPLALDANDTTNVDLAPGRYTLQLLGVAEHCSVSPGPSLEIDITRGSTIPVTFAINCPLRGDPGLTGGAGVRVTVRTTGLDLDPEYRVLVGEGGGGSSLTGISSNGTIIIQLGPGIHTIGLTDVEPNCAIDRPGSYTVTTTAAELVQVEFLVVCTATTAFAGITGNWQFSTTSTVPRMPPMRIAGSITQSGSAVSGAVHAAGSNCFDSLTTIGLTGTLTERDISLASTSAERQVITFTGSVANDSLTGIYSISGGCADGDRGTVTGSKVRPINGTWRIIFVWNDQQVGKGLAGLTQATTSPHGSFAVVGAVSNSSAAVCFEGTVTGETLPSHSFIIGRSVTLEIETRCGTVVFRGTVNGAGGEIVGRYRVFGGTLDGRSGVACLGRDLFRNCYLPPY